ncbi:MAG: metal-binding protein [Acidobacteria bacterium]|nr:metal-binding protein [Acidobacteriota bacterium]
MPSGRTHDLITIGLAIPAAAGSFGVTGSFTAAMVFAAAFIFGGLMFGPDLDTRSKQYSRWGPFRVLWYPYRRFFKHRSRFSHGLILGTAIRVIYFMGVFSLIVIAGSWIYAAAVGGKVISIAEFTAFWRSLGETVRNTVGDRLLLTVFLWCWLGAASHTFTDLAGTFIKTGRRTKLF